MPNESCNSASRSADMAGDVTEVEQHSNLRHRSRIQDQVGWAFLSDAAVLFVCQRRAKAEAKNVQEQVTYNKQGERPELQGSLYDQQLVYTSMAGEDGSLVMLGDPLSTHSDEGLPPKPQEPFVLLDGIPQVGNGCTQNIPRALLLHGLCLPVVIADVIWAVGRSMYCSCGGRAVYVLL